MAAALEAQLSQQTNRNKFVDVGVKKQSLFGEIYVKYTGWFTNLCD
jgi:hypothetical protein